MDLEYYDNVIREADIEVQTLKGRAENMKPAFSQAVLSYLKKVADYLEAEQQEKNAKAILSLADEQIDSLRKRIAELVNRFSDRVDSMVNNQVSWAHKMDIKKDDKYLSARDLVKITNSSIDDVMRLLLGEIGALFVEYKLADLGPNSEWKKSAGSSSIIYGYGLPEYTGSSSRLSDVIGKLRTDYLALIEQYIIAVKKLDTARHEKEVAEAKSRWNKAND